MSGFPRGGGGGGGGTGTISNLINSDGTVDFVNPTGPTATINTTGLASLTSTANQDFAGIIQANAGLRTNVLQSDTIPSFSPISGTPFQNTIGYDVIAFFWLALNNVAQDNTAIIAVSFDNVTYTNIAKLQQEGVTATAENQTLTIPIPDGWWCRMTLTNCTLNSCLYLPK